jgi:carbamoyl-phosphate synthase large subunit
VRKLVKAKVIDKKRNILITSSSSKIPLINCIKNSVRKINIDMFVYCADINEYAISKYFAHGFWNMPRLSDLTFSEIITYCQTKNIGFIIPTRDGELEYWASIKENLMREHIFVMVPCLDSVKKCLDKKLFFDTCISLGLAAIETSENINEIESDKFVVKERYGAGSINIGINLSANDAIIYAKTLESPIFQPFIKGKEYSIDVFMTGTGDVKGAIIRERIKIENGEAKITRKIENIQLEKIAFSLVKKFNLIGHSVIQIIIDEINNSHIIECNTRFGGASELSVACGLDSFYWFFLESLGEDISMYPFIKTDKQLTLVRYQTDLIK